MPQTPSFPSSTNVFVPSHEASNRMIVNFSRNPKKFDVNKYAQIVPVTQVQGYYLQMTVEMAGRILNGNLADFVFPDNIPAQFGYANSESFEWLNFFCTRYQFPVPLGHRTLQNASWDIASMHEGIMAQLAMTARTQLVVTAATNVANFASSNILSPGVASPTYGVEIPNTTGSWNDSTSVRMDIYKSLMYGLQVILLNTLSAVNEDEFILVISPNMAEGIRACQEFIDIIKQSPDALAVLRGEIPGRRTLFGLPDNLYGIPLVVEKTVETITQKGVTTVKQFVMPDATPFLCARPGGLEGTYGGPSFASFTQFMFEEMTVERVSDTWDRMDKLRVVEDYAVVPTAPAATVLYQSAYTTP
jgi:hypothetical protein